MSNIQKITQADTFLGQFLEKEGWIIIPTELDELDPKHICDWGDDYDKEPEQEMYVIGRRPHYQFESGLMFTLDKDINKSSYKRMYAYGDYGTKTVEKVFSYTDFKRNSKYKKLIENLHKLLF